MNVGKNTFCKTKYCYRYILIPSYYRTEYLYSWIIYRKLRCYTYNEYSNLQPSIVKENVFETNVEISPYIRSKCLSRFPYKYATTNGSKFMTRCLKQLSICNVTCFRDSWYHFIPLICCWTRFSFSSFFTTCFLSI